MLERWFPGLGLGRKCLVPDLTEKRIGFLFTGLQSGAVVGRKFPDESENPIFRHHN